MIQESFFPDLCNQHRRLGDLIMNIKCEHDAVELKHLAGRLQKLVRRHFDIEDRELYPILLRAVDDWEDREVLLGAYEWNILILRLLDQLSTTPPTDELYKGKVFVLERLWSYHVQEEEEPIFEMAQRYLDPETLVILSDRVRDASAVVERRARHAPPARTGFFGTLEQERKRLRRVVTAMAAEREPSELNYLAYDLELVLRKHLEVEDEVVYPVLEKVVSETKDREKVRAAKERHDLILDVLGEVAEMPVTHEEFYPKVRNVEQEWSYYVAKEEPLIYQVADQHLSQAELAALEARVRAEQTRWEEETRSVLRN